MVCGITGQPMKIEKEHGGGFRLTCHRGQVPFLCHLWLDHDFAQFAVDGDSGDAGTGPDYQVTLRFGVGDPIDQFQAALDSVVGFGVA